MRKIIFGMLISTILLSSGELKASASNVTNENGELENEFSLVEKANVDTSNIPLIEDVAEKKTIEFEDKVLEDVVKRTLKISKESPVTTENILGLTSLVTNGQQDGIMTSLKGLEYAKNLKTITFTNHDIKDLSPLRELPLVSVGLEGNRGISDFSPLNKMKIKALSLDSTNVQPKDLEKFEFKNSITALYLKNNFIEDVSVLAEYKRLDYLRLDNNVIVDISPLTNLTELTTLTLSQNSITDIQGIERLKELDQLYLAGNLISDITPLAALTKLTNLSLANNKIQSIESFQNLTNLIRINIRNNEVDTLEPILNLMNLVSIDFRNNQITDVEPVNNLKKLDNLDLAFNPLSNPKLVENNQNLTKLFLTGTGLTNDNVPIMNNLTLLDVGENQLDNIEFLNNSKDIEIFGMSTNQISDISLLSNMKKLKQFIGVRQRIDLPEISKGNKTPLSIKGIKGELPSINWITPGNYSDNLLLWENKGLNSLEWSAYNGSYSGTVSQTVVD